MKKSKKTIENIKERLSALEHEDLFLLDILENKIESYLHTQKQIELLQGAKHFDLDQYNKAIKLSNVILANILSILDRLEYHGGIEFEE